ncbi:ABC-type sugar transport system, periplasmic component [Opitutaceae bacterium TAV1]|nr:ABC-type sugar transport system, periplasmic component [Opitutaceae bacterium TAV1]
MKSRLRFLLPALVIAAAVGGSFWHVVSHRRAAADPAKTTLRIGHWLLHTGMREAFAEAAAEYQRLHPDVVIEQVAVPIRVWPAWMRTQLVGDTAPDITGLLQANEETINRYFLPLTRFIDAPNPHNAGTPLQGLRWRDTFVDGLASMQALTPSTGEVNGVHLQLSTLRVFYNKTLLRSITGSDVPPTDYATFRALENQVAAWNERTGKKLVPVAGCGPYAQYLFNALLPSQTQKAAVALSPMQTLNLRPAEVAALMLQGRLSYRSSEYQASLDLLRDVTALMPPGFQQLQRDDALFAFLQGNAVAICAGSGDYAAFRQEGGFGIAITPIPLPAPDDPDYGRFTLGPISDAGGYPESMFGIVRTSRHPGLALDFLRFLSSYRMAALFAERSLRMSAIVDVPPPAGAAELAPRLDGEAPGSTVDFFTFGGSHAHNAFHRNLHTLIDRRGDREAFLKKLDDEMPAALRRDLAFYVTRQQQEIRRADAHLGLLRTQPSSTGQPAASAMASSWTRVAEFQHDLHADYLRYLSLMQAGTAE